VIGVSDLVSHPNFGTGLVVETRHGGYEAKVDFNNCTIWVPASRLSIVKPTFVPVASRPRLSYSLMQFPDMVDFHAQHVVESLRLGIVPDFDIENMTVGRETEFQVLRDWLADIAEGSVIVEGRYGSGKTHMLRFLAQHAIENKYAVAFVRVDPGEENASFPYRLYASIMRNLRVPFEDAAADIQTVLLHRARSGQPTVLDEHPFFGRFLEAVRADKAGDDDWLAFQGEKSASRFFPVFLDFTTVSNLVCNQLSAISRFLVDDVGLAGLLILLDEVETAEVRRYNYHWQRTLNFLRGLTMVANDDEAINEQVVRGPDSTFIGSSTRLVYSGHYPKIRYSFATPSYLKVVLALTECRVQGKLREWKGSQPLLKLSDIKSKDLQQLFGKICGYYYALYNARMPLTDELWALRLLRDAHDFGSIRAFMKGTIEMLDFCRHHPGRRLEELDAAREF